MSIQVFENARPIITGADTHAADLTGDLTTSVGPQAGSSGGNGNLSGLQGGDTSLGSFSFTPTEAKNLAILRLSVHVTNNAFVSIKEGAVTLATAGGSGTGTRTVTFVVEDATIAAHTYTFNIIRNAIDYQFGQSGGFGANGPITSGVGVDIGDTHAATLSGENTQTNHESGVIP